MNDLSSRICCIPGSQAVWVVDYPIRLDDTGVRIPGWPPWRRRPLYEYNKAGATPVTLQLASDLFVRSDRHFYTDLGSVPELGQLVVPKDLHNPSYVLHDSSCLFYGLYFSTTENGEYVFHAISSEAAAKILALGFYAAGYTLRCRLVHRLVRRLGPQWKAGDAPGTALDELRALAENRYRPSINRADKKSIFSF